MIGANIQKIQQETGHKVKLIAVSKTKPESLIMEAYEAGQRVFGENKVQEMLGKYENLPKDIEWHLIGHLQTNKVKYIAPFVSLIHSVDSYKLLEMINKEAQKNNRIIQVLLQIYIAKEESKFGLSEEEAIELLEMKERNGLNAVQIIGLMGMATLTENKEIIKSEFLNLKAFYDSLKSSHFKNDENFKELSMGMSGDYGIAAECGSTMIRVGSLIFGNR
ncbi:MAG: YggS family pyridoxal phosphate-dependent enzyme [Bacteroidia bacterium]